MRESVNYNTVSCQLSYRFTLLSLFFSYASDRQAMKLLAAAKAGRLSDVASLLDQGVPVNSKDSVRKG